MINHTTRKPDKYIKILLLVLIFVLFLDRDLLAFEFSGNLSNDYKYSCIDKESLLNKNNILDFKPHIYLIKYNATGKDKLYKDFIFYYFKVRGELNFNDDYDISQGEKTYYEGKSFFVVDRFFLDAELSPNIYFLIGKERVLWGNGLIWNPIDIINPPKEHRNSKHDEEGAYMAKAEFSFKLFNLSLYYHPTFINKDNEFGASSSNAALKLNLLFSGFDLNAYYYKRLESEEMPEDSRLGFTINYLLPVLDLNVYSDIIYERNSEYTYFSNNYAPYKKQDKDLFSAIAGVSYIRRTNVELSIGLEYFHNEKGCTKRERKNYFKTLGRYYEDKEDMEEEVQKIQDKEGEYQDLSEAASEERRQEYKDKIQRLEGIIKGVLDLNENDYLNQNYIGCYIRVGEIINLIDFNNTILFSLPDFDFFYQPEIEFHFSENISIKLSSALFGGDSKSYSQFGNSPIKNTIEGSIKFIF